MSFQNLILFLVLVLANLPAKAHKVGNSNWCLMYTEAHWECVYNDSGKCEDALKNVRSFLVKNPGKPVINEATSAKNIEPVCIPNPGSIGSGQL